MQTMPVLNTGHIAAETANEFDAHGDKVLWCICDGDIVASLPLYAW